MTQAALAAWVLVSARRRRDETAAPPPGRQATAGRLFFYISAGSPNQETAASIEDTAYKENGSSWEGDAQGTRRKAKEKAQTISGLCVCRAEASEWYPVGESNPCSRRERAVS